ncbi:MAG: hypothetical protein HYV03_04880 [Deltaproteobacteria bacterium]|nr:hypothetical protein [Deltaproteobacteria bacterium]
MAIEGAAKSLDHWYRAWRYAVDPTTWRSADPSDLYRLPDPAGQWLTELAVDTVDYWGLAYWRTRPLAEGVAEATALTADLFERSLRGADPSIQQQVASGLALAGLVAEWSLAPWDWLVTIGDAIPRGPLATAAALALPITSMIEGGRYVISQTERWLNGDLGSSSPFRATYEKGRTVGTAALLAISGYALVRGGAIAAGNRPEVRPPAAPTPAVALAGGGSIAIPSQTLALARPSITPHFPIFFSRNNGDAIADESVPPPDQLINAIDGALLSVPDLAKQDPALYRQLSALRDALLDGTASYRNRFPQPVRIPQGVKTALDRVLNGGRLEPWKRAREAGSLPGLAELLRRTSIQIAIQEPSVTVPIQQISDGNSWTGPKH